MIVECLLQVVPQHQLRPIYSCSKPVKQMKSKLLKEMNTILYDYTVNCLDTPLTSTGEYTT